MDKKVAIKQISKTIDNFRDLSLFSQTYIQSNIIYRTSSPIPYQSTQMKKLFSSAGIRSIIDLRSAVEIGYSSYDDEFINEFNYFWVHLDISMPTEVMIRERQSELSFYQQFCWYTLFYNKNQIRRIFNILSRPENYSVIIHCHAGRDRTGVVSALILMLLNTPEVNIIQDYLETDENTQAEDIEFIFSEVEKVGGINQYLESCGLLPETLDNLIERLRP